MIENIRRQRNIKKQRLNLRDDGSNLVYVVVYESMNITENQLVNVFSTLQKALDNCKKLNQENKHQYSRYNVIKKEIDKDYGLIY